MNGCTCHHEGGCPCRNVSRVTYALSCLFFTALLDCVTVLTLLSHTGFGYAKDDFFLLLWLWFSGVAILIAIVLWNLYFLFSLHDLLTLIGEAFATPQTSPEVIPVQQPPRILTKRPKQVERALTALVLLPCGMSRRQLALWAFEGSYNEMDRVLKAEGGLVLKQGCYAGEPDPLEQPLVLWRPGMDFPKCGPASYQARKRHKGLRRHQVTIYQASDKAFDEVGKKPQRGRQIEHGLGLAWAMCHYLKQDEHTLEDWANEETLKKEWEGGVIPDAMKTKGGILIDYLGDYSPERISDLVETADIARMEAHLW